MAKLGKPRRELLAVRLEQQTCLIREQLDPEPLL